MLKMAMSEPTMLPPLSLPAQPMGNHERFAEYCSNQHEPQEGELADVWSMSGSAAACPI